MLNAGAHNSHDECCMGDKHALRTSLQKTHSNI